MNCLYYYKGRKIGDIIALDDFLLSKQQYYSKLGDKVFQSPPKVTTILNDALKFNEKAIKEWNQAKKSFIDDEELIKMKRPFVGTTEFLTGLKNSEGRYLSPEFREGDYWANRFHAWSTGKKSESPDHSDGFTQDEINLFFDGDESKITAIPTGDYQQWKDSNGEFKEMFGTDEQQRLRKLMTEKWENQAQAGTDIHNILEAYFKSKDRDAIDQKQNLDSFIKKLKISNLTNRDKILQVLDYAKTLRQEITKKYGDVDYYPEYTLTSQLNMEYEGRTDLKLVGRVDLLVIDSKGVPHIIDYKTSPKMYDDYARAKKLTFTYQLATYERMLTRLGLNTLDTQLLVAPIQMENFRKEGDNWVYDAIKQGNMTSEPLEDLSDYSSNPTIQKNINEYMEAPLAIDGHTEDIISKVKTTFDKWFPKYGSKSAKTDEEIREIIDKQGGFKKNLQENRYEFTFKGSSKTISAKTESELFNKVRNDIITNRENVRKEVARITRAINEAKKEDSDFIELSSSTDDWVRNKFSKYCGKNWNILEGDIAKAAAEFGMILFQNQLDGRMEVIKITGQQVKRENSWGRGRNNLTGCLELDLTEDSKSDSYMLKAVNGNLELMEAMLVLNSMNFSKPIELGLIDVINPFQAEGLSASNKELAYSWNKLNSLIPVNDNQFQKGHIKLLTKTEQCYKEFREVLSRVESSNNRFLRDKFNKIEPAVSTLHDHLQGNTEQIIQDLLSLSEKLVSNSQGLLRDVTDSRLQGLRRYDLDYDYHLYSMIQGAILELRNFKVRQNIKDHRKYFEHSNILTKGISGSMLDNAGNFENQLLNEISSLALEGYQNARDVASRKMATLRTKTEKLKKDLGFSGLLEHTVGNQASLYDGMTEYTPDGDLRFVNPWKENKLNNDQNEYLKYIILEINKNKHPNWQESQIQDKINSNDVEFFQVPLIDATMASKLNQEGWLGYTKNTFQRFNNLGKIKQSFRDMTSEFFDEEMENYTKRSEDVFKVTNMMDQGNGLNRKDIIDKQRAKHGDGFFERDLERILGQHIWAYSTKNALDDRMVLMKAAYVTLNVMGNNQNYDFREDKEFFENFVKNKINHQSIVDDRLKTIKGITGKLQQATSWMALAFAPIQLSGQVLEHMWKYCKLIITKPDGTETFTANNMSEAGKIVYKELFHFSDIPSTCTSINSQYGINDMDNVSFADNNTSNRHGMYNFFGKLAYKFSSRPDFYSRMTIFVAQMKADGSYEAHSVNQKTGELEYDYKLDKRFRAYATNDKSNMEEYNKSKALYYVTAQQLVREGAIKKDGTLFSVGDALPKAYSNKESEAKKAVADSMYGYYDSTKKSLMQATFLGGLIMQMRTYWSAKKNQYLAPGGIKTQGKWVQAEQNKINPKTGEFEFDASGKPIKEKIYYQKNEKGEVNLSLPLVTESNPNRSDIPFMQWQGRYEEGVILTLSNLIYEMKETGSFKKAINNMFGEGADPELRKVYMQNMKLLLSDFVMSMLIGVAACGMLGDWADDEIKEAKKSRDFLDSMMATFANLVHKTFKYSSNDFFWVNAIFDISMDWNPISVAYLGRTFSEILDLVMGENTFTDTIINSFSAARQVRPLFYCIEE